MGRPTPSVGSAPHEIAWWDRLLIRLPGYSLFTGLGAYGLYDNGDVSQRTALVLFFALAFPLLAGWQIFHVVRSRNRLRSWRLEQKIRQGALGVPSVPEIRRRLKEIADARDAHSEPVRPRFGAMAIFFLVLLVAALAVTMGILLAKAGMATLSTVVVIVLVVSAVKPLQVIGVQNRAYRAVMSIPSKLREIRQLVDQERRLSSTRRSTQSVDGALDASLEIIDAGIDLAKTHHLNAAAECLELLVVVAQDSWAADSRPRILTEKLQTRVNGALAEVGLQERSPGHQAGK